MSPADALTPRQMLALFNVDITGLSPDAISARARRLAKKHGGLGQAEDPASKGFIYSRKACQEIWNATKPLPVA